MSDHTPRCLVVDDDDSMRLLISLQLEPLGGVVATASTAEEADAMIAADGPFDLVLTDHRLPGASSGIAVLEAAAASGTKNLMLLSAHVAPATATAAEALGAVVVDKADLGPAIARWGEVVAAGGSAQAPADDAS